jgi:4-amino-4-deoxy-L-arabinose transferase-like glycosyltransferase
MAAVTLCFVINVTLFTYGRLPFLENGLIFVAAILFFVHSFWGDRMWGAALSGALVALAMLTGKLFGAYLLPALVLAIAFSANRNRWRLCLTAVLSFFLVSIALLFVLYGRNVEAAFAFAGREQYGLHKFPQGLTSPVSFFEHLISYGFKNRLFYLGPRN